MHDMYEKFEQLRQLMEMTTNAPTSWSGGYSKFVQTGESGVFDYNRGFLCVDVYALAQPRTDLWQARLYINTVDDGGAGAWGVETTKEKALHQVELAAEVIRDMIALPSMDELNTHLCEAGLYVISEG